MIYGILTNFNIDVMVDIDGNVFADVIDGLEFAMPGPSEGLRC